MKLQLTIPLLAVTFGGGLASPITPTQTVVGGSGAATINQNAAVQSLNPVVGVTAGLPQTIVPNHGENYNSEQEMDDLVIVTEVVTVTATDERDNANQQVIESTIVSSISAKDVSAAGEALPHDAKGPSANASKETAGSPTAQDTAAGGMDGSPTEAEVPGTAASQTVADTPSSIPEATSATSAAETTPTAESTSPTETSSATESSQSEESPSSSEGGDTSSGETYSGEGTYYTPGLGSCGKTNSATDLIAAINAPQYDATGSSNSASICGKCVQVKGPKGEVKVTIADRCPACKSGDLDLSPAAFDQIGDESEGRISISWSFVDC